MATTSMVLLMLAASALSVSGCKSSAPNLASAPTVKAATVKAASTADTVGKLRVTVSVDWEGAYISETGIEGLAAFRAALPDVPITHWVCPAYLTKEYDFQIDLGAELAEAIGKNDETLLHLHGWASLAAAAGVERKSGPSFFEPEGELVEFPDGDDGFDLELGAYDEKEFRAILRKSLELLKEAGVEPLPMFRGGAGILEKHILSALAAEGFTVDSSLIPAQYWRTEHGAPPQMGKRVEEIWGPQDGFVEPFWVDTPNGKLLEIPGAPGFGDYASALQFKEYIDEAAARLAKDPTRDVYIHLGFHQENGDVVGDTAPHSFRMRVQLAIEHMRATYPEQVVFERMSDVARRHGAKL